MCVSLCVCVYCLRNGSSRQQHHGEQSLPCQGSLDPFKSWEGGIQSSASGNFPCLMSQVDNRDVSVTLQVVVHRKCPLGILAVPSCTADLLIAGEDLERFLAPADQS